jgi:ubiquinone/menaquinone biosynthesis C-methylase UbiE
MTLSAMKPSDAHFPSAVAALYDRCLGPLLFEPYAEDLARRAAALRPKQILETAAGTGIVTEALLNAVPGAEILATDLNEAMLDEARKRLGEARVDYRIVDAQALPFADSSFDLVVCQFGVMFFPDRVGAYREARRVLRPGGHFLFNAWGSLDQNQASLAVAKAVASAFPDDPPSFLERTPFGYHDMALIEADLSAAGFTEIDGETVEKISRLSSARDAATGLCLGSPMRAEIEARDPSRLDEMVDRAAAALAPFETGQGIDAPMSANVFLAAGAASRA